MKSKLASEDAKSLYKRGRQTVKPVFGVVKSAMGFRNFLLRGLAKVETEWTLVTLA